MRKLIPIAVGAILILLGLGWVSQGDGMMGGSSLMDNNPIFIYLGATVAVVGVALIGFGLTSKARVKPPAEM